MNVFGYTEDKDVVAVDLPIDEIVSAGIDPWQLDLFDPDPVAWRSPEGRLLYSSRLDNIAFLLHRNWDSVICLKDGSRNMCIHGMPAWSSSANEPVMRDPKFSEQNFPEFFTFLLKHKCKIKLPIGVSVSGRRSADAVTLRGNHVSFDMGATTIRQSGFKGVMFKENTLAVELPEEINCVTRLLNKWKPVVFGDAIHKALASEKVDEVELLMEPCDLMQVFHLLADTVGARQISWSQAHALGFKIGDCRYQVLKPGHIDTVEERLRSETFPVLSADGLYSTRENEVSGSRIAFFDAGKRQARRLCSLEAAAGIFGNRRCDDRANSLHKRGFKILLPGY